MKNLLLILTLSFSLTVNAQIAVTDFSANAQLNTIQANLAAMSSSLSSLTAGMSTLNTTQSATKLETVNNTKQTLDQLGISKAAENYLKEVPQYLKRGQEIKEILNKEQMVVKKIQNLTNVLNTNNLPQNVRNIILNNAGQLLGFTGNAVDMSLNVLTDNIFRMEAEQRRSFLKEISTKMDLILSALSTIESQATSYSTQKQINQDYKDAYQKAIRSIKN